MKRQFLDTEFDRSLHKLNSHFMWKENKKQELKKHILSNIENIEPTGKNKTKIPFNKNSGIALTILFSLFIGSAFFSPAMAEVVSKIPYLGQIFKSEDDIIKSISEELQSKGYNIGGGVGVSYPEKEINIGIRSSQKEFNAIKNDVEGIANNILQARDYNAYTVKVNRYIGDKGKAAEFNKRDKDRIEFEREFELIHRKVTNELKKLNYNVLGFSMGYNPRAIKLSIPNTETRIEELKQVVQDTLKENKITLMPITIDKINMEEREKDRRWREILDLVEGDLLGKKEYKVRMVGYSIHPEPEIQAFITISSSDKNAKEFALQLEKVIDDFLKSKKMQSKVNNDPYHIKIFSKDDKVINE
jgi:hypothetical protein